MRRCFALVALAVLGGCSAGSGDASGGDPVALVTLGVAQKGAVAETVTLYGAVEAGPEAQYVLAAPVEALVAAVDAPAGSAVRAGQIVVRLQPSPTSRADFAKAIADARTANAALARTRRLRADGLASDADVEAARAAAAAADALKASVDTRSADLNLRARDTGHVDSATVRPGDMVAAGATVATLSRAGDLRARFGTAPAVARKLGPGAMLRIAPAGGGEPFDVPILSVNPAVDPQTRLASVYAAVAAGHGIAPGQPLSAQAPVAAASNALTIPYAALFDDGGQPYAYVVEAGVAHRRDVATGPSSGDRIVITQGLSAGDKVVTAGGTAVEDGMKVRTK